MLLSCFVCVYVRVLMTDFGGRGCRLAFPHGRQIRVVVVELPACE